MSILDKLTSEMKIAMKAHEKFRVNTIRLLISQIKNAKINFGEDFTPDREIDVLVSAAKQRKEAIEAYNSGGRADLSEVEKKELEIINEFLPKQLSDEEIKKEVASVVQNLGATNMKDLGRVMSEVMKSLKGKADGKKIQMIVRSKLA